MRCLIAAATLLVTMTASAESVAVKDDAEMDKREAILQHARELYPRRRDTPLRNRWSIGRVQRWWLEYAALQAREPLMDRREYEKARNMRVLDFPMCPDAAPSADTKSSVAKADAPAVKK